MKPSCRRRHVDRHLVAGPAASDKGAAQGTAEARIASPVQAIHPRRVEIVLEHNTTEIAKLVDIYATINRMRVLSSPKVVAAADNALRTIVATYANENATFSGIRQSISHGFPDPLRAFSEACHEELKMY